MFKQSILKSFIVGCLGMIVLAGCKKKKDPEPTITSCQIAKYTFKALGGLVTTNSYISYNDEGKISQIVDSVSSRFAPLTVSNHTMTYGSDGNLATITTQSGGTFKVAQYTWNNGVLTKIDNGDGTQYTLTYNALQQLSELFYSSTAGASLERTTYAYNEQGNFAEIVAYSYKNGQEIENSRVVFEEFDDKINILNGLPIHKNIIAGAISKNNALKRVIRFDKNNDGKITDDEKTEDSSTATYNDQGYTLTYDSSAQQTSISVEYNCQ